MTSCSSGIGVQVGPQLLPGDPPVGGRLDRDHPFGRDAVLGAPVGDGLGGQRLAVCLEELAREGGLAADEVAGALDGGGAGDVVGHVRLSGENYSSLLQRSTGNIQAIFAVQPTSGICKEIGRASCRERVCQSV